MKHGCPPDLQDSVVRAVIKQAERIYCAGVSVGRLAGYAHINAGCWSPSKIYRGRVCSEIDAIEQVRRVNITSCYVWTDVRVKFLGVSKTRCLAGA